MIFKYIFLFFSIAPCVFSNETEESSDGARKTRLVGGSYAQDGQFPYHVSIMVDGSFTCGGALIGKSHVLTAAHCFNFNNESFDAREVRVLIGHTSIEQQLFAKIIMGVVKIFIPKSYSGLKEGEFYVTGDIAVLKLGEKLDIPDEWVLKLPKNKTYVGDFGVVTGHGYNWKIVYDPNDPKSAQNGGKDGLLRFLDLEIVENDDCSKAFDNSGKILPKTFMCAKATAPYVPGALCNGDSGGPMVVNNAIVGVVSVGSRSCETGVPEIFTRVSSHRDFIEKSIGDVEDSDIQKYDLTYYSYQFD